MELDHIEAFLAIVRRGGFTRASASLHLSQPAISRRIDLLERDLGAPLFERIRTGVVLTEAGRAFLPHAEAVLASMRDGISAVGALRGTGHGTVSLAIVGTLASTTLTRCLRQFREAHPAVDLRLRTALSAEVSALVRRGDATLGLRYHADRDPDLVSTHIHDEPMLPVCSPRHRLARRRRLSPSALAGESWITFPAPRAAIREPYSAALEHWLGANGLAGATVIPIDSLTAQKRMVEAGFGLAFLPASSVDEELRARTLTVLRIATRAALPVVLIRRRRAFHSGATQALIAALTAWTDT
ncbi:MAG TPA: LysR family transcriptional regulator [Kofleriaceae bacterium]|nr:LysR family transcriptional regulator [Kofleriaceae bacterium]